jgi:hypothetical protein
MGSFETNLAVAQLRQATSPAKLGRRKRKRQLRELRRLATLLDQGSVSLNQRATTLAALAVAALGAFGVFATRFGEIDDEGLRIAAAALLAVASFSLLAAALLALWSARPAGRWTVHFAVGAEGVVDATATPAEMADHLTKTIQVQLERNKDKAKLMKRASTCSSVALVAATLAVIGVALDAAIP